MQISRQSAIGANGLARWARGLCALLLVLGVAVKSRAAVPPPDTIYYEDFEESTLGGVIDNSPLTNTTGFSPTIGAWGGVFNDDAVIVGGLDGSSKALQAVDNEAGLALRIDAISTRNPTGGRLLVSLDFEATAPLSGQGPLQFLLQTPTYTPFLALQLYSGSGGTNMIFLATDSNSALYSPVYWSPDLFTGKEYRLLVDANLDSHTYDFSVTNLTDSAIALSVTGLDFLTTTDLNTAGFGIARTQFGFADFGSTAAFTIDNFSIVAPVPEPSVALLLGVGGLLAWRRRETME